MRDSFRTVGSVSFYVLWPRSRSPVETATRNETNYVCVRACVCISRIVFRFSSRIWRYVFMCFQRRLLLSHFWARHFFSYVLSLALSFCCSTIFYYFNYHALDSFFRFAFLFLSLIFNAKYACSNVMIDSFCLFQRRRRRRKKSWALNFTTQR